MQARLNRLLDGIRARALAAANAEICNPRHEMQRVCKRLCVCAKSNRKPAFRVFFKVNMGGQQPVYRKI